MSDTHIIDGKAIAAALRQSVKERVARLKEAHGLVPGLAVVLVGDDPASQVYVGSKVKMTEEAGMRSIEHRLPADITQDALLDLVFRLDANPDVNGILVQLPLPGHLDAGAVISAIDPEKDVDGLTPTNAGRLLSGDEALVPCTPLGCMHMMKGLHKNMSGMTAVVIGRSNLVGKPLALLLLKENCTVTMAHSRTKDLPAVARGADILVAAVGRQQMVDADYVKRGATVIDVGINRIPAPERGEGKTRLVGDVDYEAVAPVAGAITPVPGGVGPMTVACLLDNTLTAALRQHNLTLD